MKPQAAQTLGQQVRYARGSLSGREAARRIGITPSYLIDIELDRRRPSAKVWKAITLSLPVYGGALVAARVGDLKKNDPDLYAAIWWIGRADREAAP